MRTCFTITFFLIVTRVFAGGVYFLDSRFGNDANTGTSAAEPWKTFAPLKRTALHPGDSVCFRRGSIFNGRLVVADSGTRARPIVLTDYGDAAYPAPEFTNPVFNDGTYGNCIRVGGSWVIVENLSFSGTAAYSPVEYRGDGWVVWEMGAIHLGRTAEHCIVRNNEIRDCVAGIRSNGAWALITHNYIHDCNRVLKEWNWGPLGIWLGADHQEVCYNRIVNYSVVDPRIGWGPDAYGSGADGGALEIDDARYPKTDISIHDNETRDNQGFLEVTWTDVKKNPDYRHFHIYRNRSDDYQQFLALWRGADCLIEDNTIIRRKVNANEWGVFNITQGRAHNIVRNNTIVTANGVVVFNAGRKGTARPETIISHNRYLALGDSLRMGKEGPGDSPEYGPRHFPLAKNGKALAVIRIAGDASVTKRFAGGELARYLATISGAKFDVRSLVTRPAIVLRRVDSLAEEAYHIGREGRDLVLTGGSDRALLYAVYDLLHRLGCVWAAPQFDFYRGQAEHIPSVSSLDYDCTVPVSRQPALAYRKMDVEEGRSHTIENLRQLIEWMPKVGLNVLQVPLNYQGAGRVKWDHWREALTPELKKRGILVEVGGHGYQNYISAGMDSGRLFRQHPEWFGRNRAGAPDSTMNLVFNTADPDAVNYFLHNIDVYLRRHPEIDVFDCWPPDVARWAQCPEMAALGTAVDRQAALMNSVDSLLKTIRPGLKLEIIAYGQVLEPPMRVELNPDVLVDLCPIDQSFERPVYDTSMKPNAQYFRAVKHWRERYTGDMGVYTYYRKYAWHSLPVILPHFMQHELRWYTAQGFRGVSTYCEPGDWGTYELNHYVLAALAWDPERNVDSVAGEMLRARYGQSAQVALTAYRAMESIVRQDASIPYTRIKTAVQLDSAAAVLRECREQTEAAGLTRLSLALDYAIGDLEIVKLKVSGADAAAIEKRVKELVDLLEAHKDQGVFVLHKDNMALFLKHYNSLK
ncbi:MAG TPA: DUF4838 domain-containing protein [Puia sp.]|nr:DUF4838 domain-containing protein [Puia sp.]